MHDLEQITIAVERAIEEHTPDLLAAACCKPAWRRMYLPMHEEGCPATTGFCSAGAEAVYYLGGGRAAGLRPFYSVHWDEGVRETHWWIEDEDGNIYDPTAAQFEDVDPLYDEGRPCGFQSPKKQPTPLAREIMDRALRYL